METKHRIKIAAILLSFLALILWFPSPSGITYLFVVLGLVFLALREFFQWMEKLKLQPYRFLNYATAIGIVLLFYGEHAKQYWNWELPNLLPFVFLLLIAYLLAYTLIYIVSGDRENFLLKISLCFFVLFYGGICLSHALLYLQYPGGLWNVLFFLLIPILTDSLAFFSGKKWGKHNAKLSLSPGKTWEGFLGGIFFTLFIVFAVDLLMKKTDFLQKTLSFFHIDISSYSFPHFFWPENWLELSGLTIALSLIVIVADLFESGLKRSLQMKDSSRLLPGHGGFFDLMDSFLWSIPIGYYYLWIQSEY